MTWIQTATGKHFDLLDPKPELVDARDIVYALSNICRFTGHVYPPYYVAQHCVEVAEIVSARAKPWGLLHDAAEAYVGDINQPLHVAMNMTIKPIERAIAAAIRERFNVPFDKEIEAEVRAADLRCLATEARDLLPGGPIDGWTDQLVPLERRLSPALSFIARVDFARFGIQLGLWSEAAVKQLIVGRRAF